MDETGKKVINLDKYYRKTKDGKNKLFPCLLAKDIIYQNGYNVGIYVIKETRDVLIWNGKYFEYDDDSHSRLKLFIQDVLDYQTTNSICEEAVGCVLRLRSVEIEIKSLNRDTNFVNLNNGIYGIEQQKLIPHNKSMLFTTCLNFEYDETKTCPEFLKFIQSSIKPEDVPFLQEVLGYCFYLSYKFPLYLFLIGSGRNGKGTFIKLIRRLFGAENISSLTPQQITEDKFMPVNLANKYVNLAGDVGFRTITDSSMIKCATGGDEITVQSKFGKPFGIINTAKFISATNEPPGFSDMTFAMQERLKYIDFPNKFPDGDPKTDPDILSKITTPDELSGIFNWAMVGLQRLLANKKFSYSKSTEESFIQYHIKSDTVGSFLLTFFEDDGESTNGVQKKVAHNRYKDWCQLNNATPKNYDKFCELMKKKSGGDIRSHRPKINGVQVASWKGIKWKNDSDEDSISDGENDNKPQQTLIPREEKAARIEKLLKKKSKDDDDDDGTVYGIKIKTTEEIEKNKLSKLNRSEVD